MIRFVFQPHSGNLATLSEGQWKLDVATRAKPVLYVRCPECAGLHEVDVTRIDKGGAADEPFFCQSALCNFCRFFRLEAWDPKPFDRSES